MGTLNICTDLVAQNATETQKTKIGTISIPTGYRRILGVAISIKSAGLTSLESIAGILELESKMAGWPGTQAFLLPMLSALTSGAQALNPFIWPVDIAVTPGGDIDCSTTFDQALTINPSLRILLILST